MPVIHIPNDYFFIEDQSAAADLLRGIAHATPLEYTYSSSGEKPAYFARRHYRSPIAELSIVPDGAVCLMTEEEWQEKNLSEDSSSAEDPTAL